MTSTTKSSLVGFRLDKKYSGKELEAALTARGQKISKWSDIREVVCSEVEVGNVIAKDDDGNVKLWANTWGFCPYDESGISQGDFVATEPM